MSRVGVSDMAAFDPERLKIVQSIYRDVIQELDGAGHLMSGQLRDFIAQDILRLVNIGCFDRAEIVASVMEHAGRREEQSESPSIDEPQSTPISHQSPSSKLNA